MAETEKTPPKWNLLHVVCASLTVVGLTTFTATPYMVHKHGGSSVYFLAYYITLFLLFTPLVFTQMKLGGATGKGIVGMFKKHIPVLTGAGIAQIIYVLITMIHITPIVSLLVYYMTATVVPGAWGIGDYEGRFPWSECSNWWNTPQCRNPTYKPTTTALSPAGGDHFHYDNEPRDALANLMESPESEFVGNKLIQGGPFQFGAESEHGGMDYPLPVCMFILWLNVALLTCFGPAICGWLLCGVCFLAIVCLLTVTIYGYAHAPANDVAEVSKYFYSPLVNASQYLSDERLWFTVIDGHSYRLNILMGFLPAIGTFHGNGTVKNNISWLFVVLVAIISPHLVLNFVIPYLAILSRLYNAPVSDIIMGGGDMYFVAFTSAFSNTEHPAAILFLLFLTVYLFALVFLAMSTLVVTDAIKERFPGLKGKLWIRIALTCALCFVCFLLGLPLLTKGWGYRLRLSLDVYLYSLSLITLFFSVIALCITYMKQSFHIVQRILVVVWLGITGLAVLVILIVTLVKDSVFDFNLPISDSIRTAGICAACAPIVLGLILGVLDALLSSNGSLTERLKYLFCGEADTEEEHNSIALNVNYTPVYNGHPSEEKAAL